MLPFCNIFLCYLSFTLRYKVEIVEATQNKEGVSSDERLGETLEWFRTYFNDPRGTLDLQPPQICQQSIGKGASYLASFSPVFLLSFDG